MIHKALHKNQMNGPLISGMLRPPGPNAGLLDNDEQMSQQTKATAQMITGMGIVTFI